MIIFVQPAGLNSPGGGPRILRALLTDAPQPFLSVCTAPSPAPPTAVGPEIHLPLRPRFGRMESTRLARLLGLAEIAGQWSWERKLGNLCRERKATAIHALAHGLDFWPAYKVSQALGLPYFLSVHDDLGYTQRGRPERGYGMARIGAAWRGAQGRFVISEEIGQEYCRRYGRLPYSVVTDGLDTIAPQPLPRPKGSLRLYFMGLFHYCYRENLRALRSALTLLQERCPDLTLSLVCRCGSLPPEFQGEGFPITLLPLASEVDVAQDMDEADLLYMPLPLGKAYLDFSRYSLSTKMITYLGSGLPILYHGPADAAAGRLLAQHDAAISLNSLDPDTIAAALAAFPLQAQTVVQNALALGDAQFRLSDQRARFWQMVTGKTSAVPPAVAAL